MKILQVIHFFSPIHGGGSIEAAYQLAKALTQRGHEVTIYSSDFEMDHKFTNSLKSVRVYHFHSILPRQLHGLIITPGMICQLRRKIKDFDVLHLHNYITFQNAVACYYARKYEVPYVFQAHGGLARVLGKKWVNKISDRLIGFKIIRNASRVIALSSSEIEEYERMGVPKDKIDMIPNGLDIESFNNLPKPGQFKKINNINGKKMILFLGRIHKIKGLDFLIKSFAELTKELHNAVLVIAGPDDGYEDEIRKMSKTQPYRDKIIFTGYLAGKEKLSAYVDADVLVVPSIYEVFGLVPFEVIMCGTPVIVTDKCGCSEWIRKSGAGYLVEYNNVDGLKKRMIKCLTCTAEVRSMAQEGREYINNNLQWPQIACQVENTYKTCQSQK
ncbi:MAG: glycosyltransferase [Dehalococcoidales bacterium]|nr:glycosyltransferase [Dehalococcoidales bacterium]